MKLNRLRISKGKMIQLPVVCWGKQKSWRGRRQGVRAWKRRAFRGKRRWNEWSWMHCKIRVQNVVNTVDEKETFLLWNGIIVKLRSGWVYMYCAWKTSDIGLVLRPETVSKYLDLLLPRQLDEAQARVRFISKLRKLPNGPFDFIQVSNLYDSPKSNFLSLHL